MTVKIVNLLVAITVVCICMHTVVGAPVISIEPESVDVTEGETITVNIMIESDVEIQGGECKLCFDNTLLNATDLTKGTYLGHDGASTMNIVKKIHNTIGVVEYGEMRTGVDTGIAGSGILASVLFDAIGSGVCDLTIGDVILSKQEDPDDPESLPVEIQGVVINSGICDISSSGLAYVSTESSHSPSNPSSSHVRTATEDSTAAVESSTDLTPPLPGLVSNETGLSTEEESSTQTATEQQPNEEQTQQSGFLSIFIVVGLILISYIKIKRNQ